MTLNNSIPNAWVCTGTYTPLTAAQRLELDFPRSRNAYRQSTRRQSPLQAGTSLTQLQSLSRAAHLPPQRGGDDIGVTHGTRLVHDMLGGYETIGGKGRQAA